METSSEYSFSAKYFRFVRGLVFNLKKIEDYKLCVDEPPYSLVLSQQNNTNINIPKCKVGPSLKLFAISRSCAVLDGNVLGLELDNLCQAAQIRHFFVLVFFYELTIFYFGFKDNIAMKVQSQRTFCYK